MLNVSEAAIKAARRQGCKAFLTHGRIDLGHLVPFLFAMLQKGSDLPEGFNSWKEVLDSEKAKREAIKRQIDERSTMPTADAKRQAAQAMGLTFSELERLANELPPAMAGLPAVDIYKRMSGEIERMRSALKAKFEEVGK